MIVIRECIVVWHNLFTVVIVVVLVVVVVVVVVRAAAGVAVGGVVEGVVVMQFCRSCRNEGRPRMSDSLCYALFASSRQGLSKFKLRLFRSLGFRRGPE